MSVEVLSSLRHTCARCGGSCQGSFAYLLDDGERLRVQEQAAALGVAHPIEDGHLRHLHGRCVFLAEDGGCRVHTTFGYDAKPTVCRQFPLVALRANGGLRAGIDPGCYASLATWQSAPEIPDPQLVAHRMDLPPHHHTWEAAFLDRSQSTTRIGPALGLITGAAVAPNKLPPGFAERWLARLKAADIGPLINLPDTPPAMRERLTPLAQAAVGWSAPPAWGTLSNESEAWAVDATRRMIHLRLATTIPVPAGVALLSLAGAVTAAWLDPRPEVFGPTVSAWLRALRAPDFWTALVPDAQAMQELATGPRS